MSKVYETFRVAMSKAIVPRPNNLYPVLFAICAHNYGGLDGFRLTDSRYSAYPGEKEFVMVEGVAMVVLGIEKIVSAKTPADDPGKDKFWKYFNSK